MPLLSYFAVAACALFFAEVEIYCENENCIFIDSSLVVYWTNYNILISNSATKLMVPFVEHSCDH